MERGWLLLGVWCGTLAIATQTGSIKTPGAPFLVMAGVSLEY
jgi:hypothetical protein